MQRSDFFFLGAAFIAFLLSVSTWFLIDKDAGLFVGIWVPSILSLGGYIKTTLKQ